MEVWRGDVREARGRGSKQKKVRRQKQRWRQG